jgi:hypothetical protein
MFCHRDTIVLLLLITHPMSISMLAQREVYGAQEPAQETTHFSWTPVAAKHSDTGFRRRTKVWNWQADNERTLILYRRR